MPTIKWRQTDNKHIRKFEWYIRKSSVGKNGRGQIVMGIGGRLITIVKNLVREGFPEILL